MTCDPMTCDNVRQLLHAYLDDELDLATALQIEQHLPGCPDCQKRLESARIVARAAAQPELYHPAPDAFREKMKLMLLAEARAVEAAPRTMVLNPWWKRPTFLSGIAAALILMLGTAALLHTMPARNTEVAELLDSHLRSLEQNKLFDVESTDQHTVKPWFAGKLDFSPPVIDLSAEGFPLVGGRVDYLNQRKVATLVYNRGKHVINLFIWPGPEGPQTESRQGYNLIRFECKGMNCWAVSDVNPAALQQFVDLFIAQNPASTRS